jgi:hypothetical protein
MKMSGTSAILGVIGAVILVVGIIGHFAQKAIVPITTHPNVVLIVVGAIILVAGLFMGMNASQKK